MCTLLFLICDIHYTPMKVGTLLGQRGLLLKSILTRGENWERERERNVGTLLVYEVLGIAKII